MYSVMLRGHRLKLPQLAAKMAKRRPRNRLRRRMHISKAAVRTVMMTAPKSWDPKMAPLRRRTTRCQRFSHYSRRTAVIVGSG